MLVNEYNMYDDAGWIGYTAGLTTIIAVARFLLKRLMK